MMNKSELIREVSRNSGVSITMVKIVLEQTLCTITECTAKGENITLNGFGTFIPKRRRSYRSRKKGMGVPSEAENGVTVSFQPSRTLHRGTTAG